MVEERFSQGWDVEEGWENTGGMWKSVREGLEEAAFGSPLGELVAV